MKIIFFLFKMVPILGLVVYAGVNSAHNVNLNENLWSELSESQRLSHAVSFPSLAPLVQRIKPSVITVNTEYTTAISPSFNDFFSFLEPHSGPKSFKSAGVGSGFIINSEGIVVTNYHVIENASRIRIKASESTREYDVDILGTDPENDIALLQIKSKRSDWPVLPLGRSSTVNVGDFAIAIGNPLGLENSISFGPISAIGRRHVQPSGKRGLFDFIQINATINPGNSGGPLVNLAGEVIAINTAITASGQGIAFSIPIDQVKHILYQLKKYGKVIRAGIGIKAEMLSAEIANEIGVPVPYGILVREVFPNSPAAKIKLQPGDVIIEFHGKKLHDPYVMPAEANIAGAGASVPIKVYRNKKLYTFTITLKSLEEIQNVPGQRIIESLGIQIENYADNEIEGARIITIPPSSLAAMAGFEKFDIIYSLNDTTIRHTTAFHIVLRKAKSGQLLKFGVKRGNAYVLILMRKP